jgi:hypothetical protein
MGVLFPVLLLLVQEDSLQEDEVLEEARSKPLLLEIIERSHIETGMLFTLFDADLDLDQHFGVYGRLDIPIVGGLYAVLEYRHYEGSNDDVIRNEDVRIGEWLAGALYRWDVWEEADLIFAAEIGWADFESVQMPDDTGFLFSFTAGLNVHVSEFFRIRFAVLADLLRTDFHDADSWSLNASGIIGIDIGF